jgi:phosphoribosyl-ATP pyrophosphohydrolase
MESLYNSLTIIDELLLKQQQLMEAVPHPIRKDAETLMLISKNIIDRLLAYLNSIGHKPWRPNPLSSSIQNDRLHEFKCYYNNLSVILGMLPIGSTERVDTVQSRRLVSMLGIIEEAIELNNATTAFDIQNNISSTCTGEDPDVVAKLREHVIEEQADILFYFLELMILNNISAQELIDMYHKKHAINLKRYADGKKNDYSWDKRSQGQL